LKKIIDQTNELLLQHNFESVQLINISDQEILLEEDFYGDPTCGMIQKENTWAVVAGTHLTLWTKNSVTRFETNEFKNIHSIRINDNNTLEILTDPWAIFSGIWSINIDSKKLTKITAFKDYYGKSY